MTMNSTYGKKSGVDMAMAIAFALLNTIFSFCHGKTSNQLDPVNCENGPYSCKIDNMDLDVIFLGINFDQCFSNAFLSMFYTSAHHIVKTFRGDER